MLSAPSAAFSTYLQQWKVNDHLYHQLAQHLGFRSDAAFFLLMELWDYPDGIQPSALYQACSLSKQTGHSALNGLERQGLVRLTTGPVHPRRKLVSLTEAGIALSEERLHPLLEAEFAAFSHLTPAEQETLLTLNARIMETLKEEVSRRYPGFQDL